MSYTFILILLNVAIMAKIPAKKVNYWYVQEGVWQIWTLTTQICVQFVLRTICAYFGCYFVRLIVYPDANRS